jgi:hypothetical protein
LPFATTIFRVWVNVPPPGPMVGGFPAPTAARSKVLPTIVTTPLARPISGVVIELGAMA